MTTPDLSTVKTASKTLLNAALQQKAEHVQVFDQTMSLGVFQLALDKLGTIDSQNFKYYALVGSSYMDLASDPDFLKIVTLSDDESAKAGILGIVESKGATIPVVSDYLWSNDETVLPPNCLYIMAMDDQAVVGSVCVHLTPLTWHYPSTGIN